MPKAVSRSSSIFHNNKQNIAPYLSVKWIVAEFVKLVSTFCPKRNIEGTFFQWEMDGFDLFKMFTIKLKLNEKRLMQNEMILCNIKIYKN